MSSNKKIKYEIDNPAINSEEAKTLPVDLNPESVEFKIKDAVKMHGAPPLSRRDFLNTGLIQFSGFLTLPSILNFLSLSTPASAAEIICSQNTISELPALITVNLAGGAGLSANWMPLDQGFQPLSSYSKMGWGNAPSAMTQFANKAPFFAGSSFLNALLTEIIDPVALLNTHFVGIAVRSQDDSGANRFDITGLSKKAGLNGSLLSNIGTSNTSTGNNTLPAFVTPPAPLIVSRYEDITGALGVSGNLSKIADRSPALFSTIQKLNAIQAQKYSAYNYGEQLNQLAVCRSQDNTKLVSGSGGNGTDPLLDTNIATIWQLNNNTSRASQNYVFGSLVYNALKGSIGSANLTIGGYDYHNGSRATGDGKDAEAGTVVGRIIASAQRLNKKTFILVTSDGSVTSTESTSPGTGWASDGGVRGSSYMIAVDPTGGTSSNGFQIGHYNSGQAADDKTLVGASPERAAAAMYANYLAFAKRMDLFEKTLPRIFSTAELDKIKMF